MNKVKVNRKRTVKTMELERELEMEQEHEQG